jgi:hypothetical protein
MSKIQGRQARRTPPLRQILARGFTHGAIKKFQAIKTVYRSFTG